jgi:choline dehydrogenase-like flavoprotein
MARAAAEVVLAGGAINSPQLLLLSGIGPAEHLREVGVDVVHELPGVGLGLQDHPLVPVIWHVRSGRSLFRAESPSGYAQWFGARRGPLTSNLAESGLFTRSGAGHQRDTDEPDLQFHFLPVKFWRQAEVDPDVDAFTAAAVLVDVHSRGSVRLRSADPTWAPAIDAGYLTDERDLDALVCGVEKAREIGQTAPLASVLAEEWSPGGTVHGRDALRAKVRDTLESLYHPVSSCRMGTDDLAVVDPTLTVRGLEGLRVADASVMPTLVRGNTNAPTIMIAERAADLITGRTVDPSLTGAA